MLEQLVSELQRKGWHAYIHECGTLRWVWACEVPFEDVSFSRHIVMTGGEKSWDIRLPSQQRQAITLWGSNPPSLEAVRKLIEVAF